ncbi:MAG: choice-of-anchor tandem repeat GloVer-containing protein, partial [Flavobacteriales bacterium]
MKKIYLLILALGAGISQLTAQALTPHFFGVTTTGSGSDAGTIYRTDTNGTNLSIIDTFDIQQNGRGPANQELLEVNGKMYGVTNTGGNNNYGVLFEFDPVSGNTTVRHHFDDSTGKYVVCYLLLGSNGKIYGTAQQGGRYGSGTIFEYNTVSNVLNRKQSFAAFPAGRRPTGRMVETSTGVFYGVCDGGGSTNNGTVFKYTLSTNSIEDKDDFVSVESGRSPTGGLMKANNGILYGMAAYGGANSKGTFYQFDIAADSIKKLFDFDGLNGRTGRGTPIQIGGDLYGLTYFGSYSASSSGSGTLFKYNISGDSVNPLRYFSLTLGNYPTGELVPSTSGKYLITMSNGGANNYAGTILELTLSTRAIVARASFDNPLNGSSPRGNLTKSTVNGKYYGLASRGGAGGFGTIVEFDPINDTLINKHNFSPSYDGKKSTGGLVKASNGKLYGITEAGGLYGSGTIFEVDPTDNTVIKKADFTKTVGRMPIGGLTLATNGKLYGVTSRGAYLDRGAIFEYDISTNSLIKLKDIFPLASYPREMIQATNGKLYGVANYGGLAQGMLFSYDITLDTLIRHDSFRLATDGGYPQGKLLQATNGKLYGTTSGGGTHGKGTVFEFDINADSIKVLDHFTDSNGASPYGGLTQIANGNIYGATIGGNITGVGGQKYGVVYQLDLVADTIIPLANFNLNTNGYGGYGEFLEASNGKLYITSSSTAFGDRAGIINEFDPATNLLVGKTRLPGRTYGSLIELVSPNNASIDENKTTQ